MIKLSELQNTELQEALCEYYDFVVAPANYDSSWVTLKPNLPFQVVGTDGSGGSFIAYGKTEIESSPILYASSEGQAGKIADNLTNLISTILAIPYWFDLLKFSDHGNLSEMRRAATYLAVEHNEDYPDISESKKSISSKLKIVALQDPISKLHSCVSDTNCTLVSNDAWEYETLFGNFKTADNKFWS